MYEVRDALSKAVYERTFQYIVDRLNEVLDRQRDTEEHSWIGVWWAVGLAGGGRV